MHHADLTCVEKVRRLRPFANVPETQQQHGTNHYRLQTQLKGDHTREERMRQLNPNPNHPNIRLNARKVSYRIYWNWWPISDQAIGLLLAQMQLWRLVWNMPTLQGEGLLPSRQSNSTVSHVRPPQSRDPNRVGDLKKPGHRNLSQSGHVPFENLAVQGLPIEVCCNNKRHIWSSCFSGVHALHGCSAILIYFVLPLTGVFLQPNVCSRRNSSFPFLFDLLCVCLCLFAFVFNAFHRRSNL